MRFFCPAHADVILARPLLLAFALLIFANPGAHAQAFPNPTSILPTLVRRDDRASAPYEAEATLFPSVGSFRFASGGGVLSSGVLIAPDVVLTVGHSIFLDRTASDYVFTVGGAEYRGSAFYLDTYTNFNESLAKGDDIAAIRLETTVVGVAPAVLNRTNLSNLGVVGVNVGFGFGGTGLDGYGVDLGIKRASHNVVDRYGDFYTAFDISDNTLLQDFDKPGDPSLSRMGDATPLDLEGSIAPGDSGGGLFQDFGDVNGDGVGDGFLLSGVHSFLDDYIENGKSADYGDLGGSTRILPHLAFVDSVIAGTRAPTPSNAPEPGTLALFMVAGVLGGGGTVARRRRRQGRA